MSSMGALGLAPGCGQGDALGPRRPMPERVRIFTVAEANALLPRLNVILERQMALLAQIDALSDDLKRRGIDPKALQPSPNDSPEALALKAEISAPAKAFREGWAEVEALGVVVKDIRTGLLDFYGRR